MDDAGDLTRPIPEDFPTCPAWEISIECLFYMMRRREQIDFNASYHDMAARLFAGGLGDPQLVALHDHYHRFKQPYLESYLCRTHDAFVQYVEGILFSLVVADPSVLTDAELVKFAPEENEWQDETERFHIIAENIVRRLGASRITELCSFLRRKSRIDLLCDADERRFIVVLSALRNLIVHNDCVVSPLFERRISGTGFQFELLPGARVALDSEWLVLGSVFVDRAIFRFDDLAVRQFSSLKRTDRRRVVWNRSVRTPAPGGNAQ